MASKAVEPARCHATLAKQNRASTLIAETQSEPALPNSAVGWASHCRGVFVTQKVHSPEMGKAVNDWQYESARRYPLPDVKMLFGRSAGRCGFPGCRHFCIQAATPVDRAAVVGKIAHVVAHSDGGPR